MEKITVKKEQAGKRIDKFLAEEFFLYSRAEIARKIKKGGARVNTGPAKPSYVLEEGDILELENFSKEKERLHKNPNIDLEILFENENMIVINKQPGIQVHPGGGEKENTLANALVAMFPEIEGVHDGSDGAWLRPGIVHRLDKDTSGVMVVTRNQKMFDTLKKAFKNREVVKKYVAISEGIFSQKEGLIDKPIARSIGQRKQIIARENTKTTVREAITGYKVLEEKGGCSLVELSPKTGRMHQIRVHLASLGHPIVGDTVYGNKKSPCFEEKEVKRQMLHAKSLEFGLAGEKYSFTASIPKDFAALWASLDGKTVC